MQAKLFDVLESALSFTSMDSACKSFYRQLLAHSPTGGNGPA